MNPNIQHDLVQARIADMQRQASRINAGERRTAMSQIRWWAIGLMAAALAFLAGTPAALAIRFPHPAEASASRPHRQRCSAQPQWAPQAGRSC
jgi:hypothetical protein